MNEAIICDLDGTLALIGDRSPYEPETVAGDLLNTPVASILEAFRAQKGSALHLIFVTGRYERYRAETEAWLHQHGFTEFELYMRRDGDHRKDIIYKKEIFHRHIEPKYHVLFVMEDRDQTVKMWREELGLTCLQVAPGAF